MKLQHAFFILSLLSLSACSTSTPPIQIAETYDEPSDPKATENDTWDVIENGLQASIVTTDKRFTRNELPTADSKHWNGVAWKGEQRSAQLVLWTTDSITNVDVSISDFVSENGIDSFDASNADIRFVKYVITDEFGGGCGYRKAENFDASLAADILENVTSYAVKGNEARPVWITIRVPENANEGLYNSKLTLNIEGQQAKEFDFSLTVLPRVLPKGTDWEFHLDLWQNPYAVARYHDVEVWSQEHWDLLKPLMSKLASAGQKVITVSLNKRPWGGQTFDPFGAMIDWKKNKDNSWSYDYTNFDNWVEFMMDLGIKKQISCYSMVPWGNEFYYFDEASNQEVKIKAAPGTPEYEAFWVPFLKDFKAHLESKGWNTITRMAMDERKPKEMKALFKMLKKHAPEFGASLADNHKSYKLYPDQLMDLSVAFGAVIDEEDLIERKANGFVSTHYVCCSDEFPNVFTFSEPAEADFIGWYSIAAEFDGFLRWAYNSWVEKPMQDSRFRTWPAGDTSIVYPDNRSSIRFERLLEGIQDAEKIRILRADFSERDMQNELRRLNKLVASFNTTDRPEKLNSMVRNGKNTLNNLSKN